MRSSVVVLTEAHSHDLTTLARAKRELGLKASDRSRDADIREDITMASQMCAEYCRRPFGRETVREVVDYDAGLGSYPNWNQGWIVLQRKPIVEMVSVSESTDDPLVLNTDYYIDAEHGMIRRGTIDSWKWWRFGKLTIEYTAGYHLLDSVPWSYERACLIVLRGLWFSRGRDPAVRSVDLPDVGSRTYASGDSPALGVPLEAQQLLQPHRRMF